MFQKNINQLISGAVTFICDMIKLGNGFKFNSDRKSFISILAFDIFFFWNLNSIMFHFFHLNLSIS